MPLSVEKYSDICRVDSTLRPYQQIAKENIFTEWDEHDSVMLQMPTGTGKTRLFTSLIADINQFSIQRKEAVKIIIIAHRTELIDQIDESLDKYKVAHGVIAGGHERKLKYPVQVASIQTLTNKHNLEVAKKVNADFVIIDEAHHSLARTYKTLWKLYPRARKLGVTATPWRMSGSGFVDLFDKLILTKPVKWFIQEKYLSNYQYFSLKQNSDIRSTIDDIDDFDIEGDYKTSALERAMNTSIIRAQLLDSYLTLAGGKKGIIYAISQAHSKQICEDFQKRDIRIVAIDSKTPKRKRLELVNKFKRNELDIIVNVDIFSEGFDCPDIEFVQLARPTCSLAKYLQQVGRALRTSEDKNAAIILDNVGMYSRFGLPDARRHWMHHFIGNNSSTEIIVDTIRKKAEEGNTVFKMKEGNEPMVLIQQTGDILGEEENVEIIKDFKIGPITYESGFVWTDPKHRFINGVHYYEDCMGNNFRMYCDPNGQWHFEMYDRKHPGYWKNLIQTSKIEVTDFTVTCNAAKLSGSSIQFVGLNVTAEDTHLLDFVELTTKKQIFFSAGDGTEWSSMEDYYENRSYVDEGEDYESEYFDEDGKYIDIKEHDDIVSFRFATEFVNGVVYIPDGEPIALVDYEIEEREYGKYAIIANLNNGSREEIFVWNCYKDFSKWYEKCLADETPCMILGVWHSLGKGGQIVYCYTQDHTAEESIVQFDEFGMYYDEKASKERRKARAQQLKAEKKKKNVEKKQQKAVLNRKESEIKQNPQEKRKKSLGLILESLKKSKDARIDEILTSKQVAKREFLEVSIHTIKKFLEDPNSNCSEDEALNAIEKWASETAQVTRKSLKHMLALVKLKQEKRLQEIRAVHNIDELLRGNGYKQLKPFVPLNEDKLYSIDDIYTALEKYANAHSPISKNYAFKPKGPKIINEVPEPKLNMRKRRKRMSES